MAYVTRMDFTATTNTPVPVTSRGETNKGTFVVGTTVAGAAGTVVLEGAPDQNGPWYAVNDLAGAPISSAVTTGVVSVKVIDGNHAFLRSRCSVFTSGVIPAWISIKDRKE